MQFSCTKSTMPFVYCTMAPAQGKLSGSPIFAMHAAVLADQPFKIVGLGIDPLAETHDGEAGGCEVHGVYTPMIHAHVFAHVVPFKAGHLAGLAADALGGVDEFCRPRSARRRRRYGGRRAAEKIASGITCVTFWVGGFGMMVMIASLCRYRPGRASMSTRKRRIPASQCWRRRQMVSAYSGRSPSWRHQ